MTTGTSTTEASGFSSAEPMRTSMQVLMPAQIPFGNGGFAGGEEASLTPLFHSLRRQWVVGTVLGVALSIPLAYAVWKLLPPQFSSAVYMRLAPQVQLVFETADSSRGDDFRSYKNTQRQLLVSPFVLHAAINSLDTTEFAQVHEMTDPEKWLEKNLKVTYPEDAEIMKVELVDTNRALVKPVLTAVISAYERDIVFAEKDHRVTRLANLQKIYDATETKVREKRESLKTQTGLLGTSDSHSLSLAQQATMQQFGLMRNELTRVTFELMKAEGEAELLKQMEERRKGTQESSVEQPADEVDLDRLAESDRQIAELSLEKTRIERLIEETRKRMSRDVAAQRIEDYEEQIKGVSAKIDRRIEHLRALGTIDLALGSNDALVQANQRVEVLKKQQVQLTADVAKLEDETKKYGISSIEVEMMRTELASMDEIAQELWSEIERSKIEQESPLRITRLNDVSDPVPVDSKKRVASAIFAGSAGFALPLIVLTLLDRRRRVIDTPNEVTSNLRVRLLGTLPEVPTRVMRQLNDESRKSSLWRWRLTESINSVAAMVQRNAVLEDRRALLISSANAGEGKSTLATYLATSLAESGYNTLLIDFDLRRPSLQSTFGVPLSPGVTDIPFSGVSLSDAIVPTETANLHLLPAGQWRGSILSGARSGAIKELLATVRDDYEFVIIDACPVLATADACLVGQHSDGVLLSVRRDVSQLPNVTAACESLRSHGIDILGTVVAGCSSEAYRQSDYLQLTTT